jgi:hypothetical protein
MTSHFDYDYAWAYFPRAITQTCPRSTKIAGLGSYTLVNVKGDPIPEKNIKGVRKMIAMLFMRHASPNGAELEYKD